MEAIAQALQAVTYLRRTADGYTLSPVFENLDQSEKTPVSYRLGMGLTNLVYQQHLGVPRLVHVDLLLRAGSAQLTRGSNKRGDLTGEDRQGGWHVVEAKGRSSNRNNDLVASAKLTQAQRVVRIKGLRPVSQAASCVFTRERPVEIVVEDPNGGQDGGFELECDSIAVVGSYYRQVTQLFDGPNVVFQRHEFFGWEFDMVEIHVENDLRRYEFGVATKIRQGFAQDTASGVARANDFLVNYPDVATQMSKEGESLVDIGPDGTILRAML